MYLSRIPLNLNKRNTMRALYSWNQFHGALASCFSGEETRNLWRIDRLNNMLYMLVLSRDKADFSSFCSQFGLSSNAWETKNYDLLLERLENGTLWNFRLTANPTISKHTDGKRGKVYAHITPEHQMEWLMKQSEKHGFQLSYDGFYVVENQWKNFYKKNGSRVTILSVTYEGILKITDVDLFREALIQGIGRGKAYGMGLLTVMQI